MKIQRTKCEHCGKENGHIETTIELREIFRLRRPELGNTNREAPNYDPPCVGLTMDFCNPKCLLLWLVDNNATISRE